MKFAALMGLAVALLFNAFRKYWVGLLLGALAVHVGGSAIPFVSYQPYIVIMAIIAGYGVVDYALKKRAPFIRWRLYYTLFFLAAVSVTVRVIYDRPGGANLGSQAGGMRKAVEYIFAFWAFFVAYWATTQSGMWKSNLKLIIAISLFCYLTLHISMRYLSGTFLLNVYGLSFNWALYPVYAAMLVVSLSARSRRLFSDVAYIFVSCFVLTMGAISQTRAAMIQVPLMVLCMAFIYRRVPTAIITLTLVGLIGLGTLLSVVSYHNLPDNVRRPISIFMGEREAEASYGRKDEFREVLNRYADKKMAQSPWVGNGWAFDVGELLSSMNQLQGFGEGGAQLEMTGAFHNVYLTIAVNNGIPTAACIVLAMVLAMYSLAVYARSHADDVDKAPIAFLLTFCSSVFVMYFVNGGVWDAFALSALLGVASALRDKFESQRELIQLPTSHSGHSLPEARKEDLA